MRVRYFSFLTLGVAAAFMVVATAAYGLTTIDDLSFGVGLGMLVLSLGIAARYRDQLPTVAAAGAGALISAWMVVGSLVFSNATIQNLTFADALAVCVVAAAGLTLHELGTERVVHSLELRAGERDRDDTRERIAA